MPSILRQLTDASTSKDLGLDGMPASHQTRGLEACKVVSTEGMREALLEQVHA